MSEHLNVWEKIQQISYLVENVPPEVLERVSEVAKAHTFAQGEALFRQGEMPTTVYILLSGAVALERYEQDKPEPSVEAILRPFEMVGDHSCYYQHPYPYDAIALEPTEVIAIPAAAFIEMIEASPQLRQRLGYRSTSPVSRAKELLPDLREDEEILFVQRRHWILLLRRLLLGPLTGMLLATILFTVAILFVDSQTISRVWFLVGWGALMMVLTPWLAWIVLDWLNDYFIVTNQRAIHIEQIFLYKEERREAPFEKVQDVQLEQATIIHTLLDYGNVRIATASNSPPILFDYVPHPAVVQRLLTEHRDRFAQRVRKRAEEEKRRLLRRALGLEPPPEQAKPSEAPPPQAGEPEKKRRFTPLHALGRRLAVTTIHDDGTIVWRKHWIALIGRDQAWKPLMFLLLTVVGMMLLLWAVPELSRFSRRLEWLIFVLYGVFMVFGFGWLLWTIEDWRNDVYILTKDAIVDEEREPLGFDVRTRRAPLTTIQDISYNIPNMLYTFFDVGHVTIETASQEGKLTFDFVHHPREVAFHIYQRLRDLEEEERVRQQARLDQSILEILKLYNEEVVEKRLPPSTSQAS